jgi:hypothetical protein
MSKVEADAGAAGSKSTNFEFDGIPYAGTWSEAHRHDCELEELAMMSPSDMGEQIERIKSKRGEVAAQQMNIAAMQKRSELVASGKISAGRVKPKAPVTGYGQNRAGNSNAYRGGVAKSGPIF